MATERVKLLFDGDEPQRLDRFLAGALARFSRSYMRRIIAAGNVTVDGRPAKPSHLLRGGEEIEVQAPPPRRLDAKPEPMPLRVLYEDEHLIVVDKPPGMVVHPAPGHPNGTLVNGLLAHCRDLSGIGGALRPGIVHRLDIGTSGAIAVAKSDEAHRGLAEQFKDRAVEKRYAAVVFGLPHADEGLVEVAIGRDRRNRKKISAASDRPRETVSSYSVVERFGELAHLSVQLQTGRTHQVRVHMAHIGHPLVGDSLYGGARWRSLGDPGLRTLARSFGRPALHAELLAFRHPLSGRRLEIRAPLPPDLVGLLSALRVRVRAPR